MKTKIVQLIACLALLWPGVALAQETGLITGRVVEGTTDEPIPGANVILEPIGRGAATDLEGNYEIVVPPGDYTLVVSFLGFRRYRTDVTVQAGETVVENVELIEDRLGLEEVVVTGQATAIETKRLSTTIDVITPRQIEATPANRLDELLQAQLPGSQVRFSSGQPGTASLIRSRGVTSANTSTTPVIYVDGVRVDNLNTAADLGIDTGGAQSSALPDIPLENIERIEFIKGGAATTLYGSDAANGVIQIFTKQGLPGRSSLTFETELGSMWGTTDFLRFQRTADVLYDPGLVQQYRLSGTGGIGNITYAFSGSMYEDNGFRLGNEQIQYGLRTSVGAMVTPITRYQGSFGFSSNLYTRDYNANTSWSAFGNLEGGSYGLIDTLAASEFEEIEQSLREQVGLVDIEGDTKRFQTSQQLDFQPLPSVTAKVTAGLDYRVNVEQDIGSPAFLSHIGSDPTGSYINRTERRFLGLTLEGTLGYERDFGPVSTNTRIGAQVFRDEDRQVFVAGNNIAQGTSSVDNAAEQDAQDLERLVANYGIYALENFGFGDRFFIDLGLRLDANSAFGEEIGWVAYPKAGFAYTLTSEPFVRSVLPEGLVSNIKLRGSMGYAGNFPTPFANNRLVNASAYLGNISYNFGQFGNVDLRPEKVRTVEGGVDLGLFNERLALEVTYYNALTQDALFLVPYAPTSGRPTQLRNVGEILNRGWEISSQFFVVSNSNLDVRLGASFNTLYNEVVDNGGTAPFAIGGFSFLGQWIAEGQPVGYLRGAQPIFNESAEVVDVERNAFLGSPLPDAFGNLSLTTTFRNRLRFFIVADYQWGAQGVATDDVLRFFSGVQDEDRFPRNAEGEIPALEASFFDLAGAWVEDTDFLKVRLISLSYTLPEEWLRGPLGLRNMEVGVRVVNPFNFASSSFDPEITGSNANRQNSVNVGAFGYGTESPPRQLLFNVRVGF